MITSSILSLFLTKNSIIESEVKETIPIMLFSAVIFAPIVEELVNRCAVGLFLEKFIKNNNLINIITSIIFVFLHLFKMKLDIVGLIIYGIIYFLLRYTCGYYYRKTDNILLSMLIHFLWNLFMFIGVILRNII